jgi:hypothetical protein
MPKESRRAMCPRIWNRNQAVVRRSTSLISQEKIQSESCVVVHQSRSKGRVRVEQRQLQRKSTLTWASKKRKLALREVASKAISGWLLHAHEDVPKDFSVLRSKHMGDVREYYYGHIKLYQQTYDYSPRLISITKLVEDGSRDINN